MLIFVVANLVKRDWEPSHIYYAIAIEALMFDAPMLAMLIGKIGG